jgi:stage II sporulation protein E
MFSHTGSRHRPSSAAISSSIRQYSESSAHPTREELSDLILECSDKYCRACEGRGACISKGDRRFIENTYELADLLYSNGRITPEDLSAYPEYCRLSPNIAEAINRGVSILSEEKFKQMKKDSSADDFAIIAKLINEARIADEREKALNEELSERLAPVMSDAGLSDGVIRAFGERRPYFILAAEDESGTRITAPELKKNIEAIADVRLGTPEFYRRGNMALMECPSAHSYAAECAVASIAGEREDVSGDTAAAFESEDGYFYSLISDGMGSGREAKETSSLVVDFMTRALEFSPEAETVLKILNHTVRQRTRECSATVDLFSVDLYRGDAEFLKSGAAASYVKRGSSIFRIKSKTAPIGLMKNVDAERIKIELEGDDYIIMMSDGIAQSAEDTPWLLDLLSKPPKRNLKEYADFILSSALKNLPRTDDMTVLVTRVIKTKD